ncbi:MAG: aldehyde ferredoxin oxidoreductase family protein [bacterium]|nr:aldehyde ferredoxin oxidoreductase family protein [bacterium]
MTIKSGYFKKNLYVDLTAGTADRLDLSDSFVEKYIGGRGFGAKLVWDNLKKHNFKIDPLGPENLLVVAPGPLTGVYLPSSGKCGFITISPATKMYGDSSAGGGLGVELRQSGVDVLSVTGKAPELSILFIDNDETTIIPMPQLKGKTCLETEGLIIKHLGTHAIHVAAIGVGGENMVNFACVNTDWSRNAGRTGVGAVMGSKNLKAIVVRGHKDLPVFDLEAQVKEANKGYKYMRDHKYFDLWQQEGLMNVIEYANEKGILPTYNFKDSVYSKHSSINGEVMLDHFKIGDTACFSCSMCCGNICLVKNGKYTGTVTEGPEYESCAMLGSNLGIDDFAAILSANNLCDELGVDTISAGNLIGAVIDGYEQGILTLDDIDGREISWGDEDAILELIRKIAHREGLGDLLAGGALTVIEKWPEMDKVILHVKGLEQSAYDSRAAMSMGISYATSDIGAHHARAWPIAKEMEEGQDWSEDEMVDTVIYHQKLRPLFDMLGVCRLPWIELGLNERHYENFYTYTTGKKATLEELLDLSNEIYNLTRLINTRLGFTRKDDNLPYKVHSRPALTGPNAGKVLDQEKFQRILSLYYSKRGWSEDGIPPADVESRFD